MPTTTDNEPDTTDLDTFFMQCPNRFGVFIHENSPNTTRPTPSNLKPTACFTKNLRSNQIATHFFQAPTMTATIRCLCNKFHTKFISTENTTYSLNPDLVPVTSNSQTKKLLSRTLGITEFIPPSPTANTSSSSSSDIHTHKCYKCNLQVYCQKKQDNKHYLHHDAIFYADQIYHKKCLNSAQSQQSNPLTTTLQPLTSTNSPTTSSMMEIDPPPSPTTTTTQRQPQVQTQQVHQQQPPQQKTQTNQSEQQQQMQSSQQEQQYQQTQSTQQEQQQTSKNDSLGLDWFQLYPVIPDMEPYSRLNTLLSQQIFDFIKPFLINFKPGQISKQATDTQRASKYTFNYLLKQMAGQQPKFLSDLIYQHNPSIDRSITRPFEILFSTFKDILLQFTTTLFTKFNYPTIFTIYPSIPPYPTHNRNNIALNLARLHLYLQNNYQTINRSKFIENIHIHPLSLKTNFFISEDSPEAPLLKIQNDNKFNINISLNIPKQQFLETFRIPSLKPYISDFDSWFESFYNQYKRQFKESDEQHQLKTYNHIKRQISYQVATACKRLLPKTFDITSISLLHERSQICTKAALFHIHTCTHSTKEPCTTLPQDTEHNFQNLSKFFFEQ